MIDAVMRKPLTVRTHGTAGPFIGLPVSQMDDVRRLLDGHGIGYTVDEFVISFEGAPEVGTIDLGRGANADAVRSILDSNL